MKLFATTLAALLVAMFLCACDKPEREPAIIDTKAGSDLKLLATSASPIAVQAERGDKLYLVEKESGDAQLLYLLVTLPESVKVPADRLGGFRFESITTNTGQNLKGPYGAKTGVGHSAQWSELKYNAEKRQITVPAWIASPLKGAETFSTKGKFNLLYWEGEQRIETKEVVKRGEVFRNDDLELKFGLVDKSGLWLLVSKGQGYWVKDIIIKDGEGKVIASEFRMEANANTMSINNFVVTPKEGEFPEKIFAEIAIAKSITLQPLTFEIKDAKFRD
ncbi:MAG: hypothetical protein KDB07_00120 [Planctomycetes bacterium]|nr:hypothetical protein [Planctomycetota bacterium]